MSGRVGLGGGRCLYFFIVCNAFTQSAVCVGEHASADDEDVLQTFFKLHGRNVSVVAEHEHGTLALKVCHVPHSLDVPNLSRFNWGG